jgi:peptidoglycan/xylan/chitin deacetylase (PgdA/CDA1 family)
VRAILTYHSIDPSGSPISVAPDEFAEHVRVLASGSVKVVPLDAISSTPDDADAVAITFDDGYTNFADVAWPLLRDHHLPTTLFVVSDKVGGTNDWDSAPGLSIPSLPLLSWSDLARLASEGLTLGAHGRTHASLPGLSPAQLADEVLGSRDRIGSETGALPTSFAYPFGDLDPPAVASVRTAFTCAVTTQWRVLTPTDDRHLLPRLDAYYFRGNHRLDAFGTASFSRWLALRGAARSIGAAARRLASRRDLGKPADPSTMDPRARDADSSRRP